MVTLGSILREHPEWAELPVGIYTEDGSVILLGNGAGCKLFDWNKYAGFRPAGGEDFSSAVLFTQDQEEGE